MKLSTANEFLPALPIQAPHERHFSPRIHPAKPQRQPDLLAMDHAIQIKAAEHWLKLGEADQALRELEDLPHNAWNHPSAVRVRVAAIRMLRERSETAFRG